MPQFVTSPKQLIFLLIVIALTSSMVLSKVPRALHFRNEEMSESSDSEEYDQRRTYDLEKLRRFLLTSNAEQRAEKREKQDFHKRALIREYLQSLNDPDRLEEVKKRIKTFCNSYEDVMNSDLATCG